MVRICDYLTYRQPVIFQLIKHLFKVRKPRMLKQKVNVKVWFEDCEFDFYKEIMEERPKPGRAGIMPEERKREEQLNGN
jgi:hypothetical protein